MTPNELGDLGDMLAQLWLLTIGGMLLASTDFTAWEWRVRKYFRVRRLRLCRAERLLRETRQLWDRR